MATGRPSPIGPHPAGSARHFPERIGGHTKLDEHLPVDHRLSTVYRIGAGLMGLVLVAFGILGLTDNIGFFDTGGATAAGLNTNGALSVLSIAIGLLLFIGMVIGGNFASTLNMVLGLLFLLSGFVNLALLETSFNFLAFRLQNVMFSFVVGLMLMWFGMYGRVSSKLPHDNPYWISRHPEQAQREARAREIMAARRRAAEGGAEQPGQPEQPAQRSAVDRVGGEEAVDRRQEEGGQPPGKWGKLDRAPGDAEAHSPKHRWPHLPRRHRGTGTRQVSGGGEPGSGRRRS
ncbi:conserved hypothetical protein [Streptomyces himastatinicus ATCC 53653]|uniref:Uncharacterized protein n=1 Tax=Streptomyces himastatinicus ATCC 53653 TaxID=457427 RepID=D9WUV2_9ACTN|nr:conserved hypothetical protein [Streptomyces himastatinicus ATCC 53653]